MFSAIAPNIAPAMMIADNALHPEIRFLISLKSRRRTVKKMPFILFSRTTISISSACGLFFSLFMTDYFVILKRKFYRFILYKSFLSLFN